MKKIKSIALMLLSTLLFLPVCAQSLNDRQNELIIRLHSLVKKDQKNEET